MITLSWHKWVSGLIPSHRLRSRKRARRDPAVVNDIGWCQPLEDRVLLSATPVGDQFRVAGEIDDWGVPSVAVDSHGNSVVTWVTSSIAYAQRYNAQGVAQGDPIRVVGAGGFQFQPTVAMNSDGKFVVCWIDSGAQTSTDFVFAQVYNADGSPHGTRFQVNETNEYSFQLRQPHVAINDQGDIVIAYDGGKTNPFNSAIIVRRFKLDGTPLTHDIKVARYDENQIGNPTGYDGSSRVAIDSRGGFVVAWYEIRSPSLKSLKAQRFDSQGNPLGSNILIDASSGLDLYAPSLAMGSDGEFAVAWLLKDNDWPDNTSSAFVRSFDSTGVPLSPKTYVGTAGSSPERFYSTTGISMYGRDNIVVTWAKDRQVAMRRFDAAAIPLDTEETAGLTNLGGISGADFTPSPQVAGNSQGTFVVAWSTLVTLIDSHIDYGNFAHIFHSDTGINFSVPDSDALPSRFYWNRADEDGGFTFTYYLSVSNGYSHVPDTSISFRWSNDDSLAYLLNVTDDSRDMNGNLLKARGQHVVRVKFDQMMSGARAPSTNKTVSLVMTLEDAKKIDEDNEGDNTASLEYVPLVVNVLTHGWQSTGADWVAAGYDFAMDSMPMWGAILDQRIGTYVSNWDSNPGFTEALVLLIVAQALRDDAAVNALNSGFDLALALHFEHIAKEDAALAKSKAIDAAETIAREVEQQYLLPQSESNRQQRIQLIGHSRGGAVNALVSRNLMRDGYHNIIDYVSLDGFASDWPLTIGSILAGISISENAVVGPGGKKLNYQVQLPLTSTTALIDAVKLATTDQVLVNFDLSGMFGDLRAPSRAAYGFTDILAGQGGTVPSVHTNISNLYFFPDSSGLPARLYKENTYEGQFKSAGLVPASATTATAMTSAASALPSSPTYTTASDVQSSSEGQNSIGDAIGFIDGDFETLGSVWAQVSGSELPTVDNPLVTYYEQRITDPAWLVSNTYTTAGDVKLVAGQGNTAVQLTTAHGDASLSQTIALPGHAVAVKFDLIVQSVAAGDTLRILQDGQVLSTIALTGTTISGHKSISLKFGTGFSGTFTFELKSAGQGSTVITLDNLQITTNSHAPTLTAIQPVFPTISATIADVQNVGLPIEQLAPTLNAGFDVVGIAITASNSAHGKLQYSFDDGDTWTDMGAVDDTHALLLRFDSPTRIRFVPDGHFSGQVDGVVTFRAWDQTNTGIGEITGDYVDASVVGGTSGFSSATDTASITITAGNNAPVLNPAGNPMLTAIAEDVLASQNPGTLVSQIIASMAPNGSITDADARALKGLAIIGADQSNGTWQFSVNGGTAWTDFGTTSSSNAILLNSDALSRVRFLPKANFNGTAKITYLAWDRTDSLASGSRKAINTTGSTTPFSTKSEDAFVTVTGVNDAPIGTAKTITILEDTPYLLKTSDFGFTDPTDVPANSLLAVKIKTVPLLGSLTNSGIVVSTGAIVSVADIVAGKLKYSSVANKNGAAYAAFTFQVQDNGGGTANSGIDTDPVPRKLTIIVTPVNDAPMGTAKTVTMLEEMSHVFIPADFGFSDATDLPANALAAAKITTIPTAGSLTKNGVAITAGARIALADIASGKFSFKPAANKNGASYASFTFQVQDNGGTANGGIDTDPTPRKFTLNVTPVNDAPDGAAKTVTTLEDKAYVFTAADFGFTDVNDTPANTLVSVKITTLPAVGILTNNGAAIGVGAKIAVSDINGGKLKFTPIANKNGANYASFTFQVQDNGGTANGGMNTALIARKLTINVTSVNDPPVGTAKTVTTFEDRAYLFLVTDFGFTDPKDAPANTLFAVKITTLPSVGSLTDNGLAVTAGKLITVADISGGNLKFTPVANKNGSAYASFTFQVQDNAGTADGGVNIDATARKLTINVTAVNDAPTGKAKVVTMARNTVYIFKVADFGFTDTADSPPNTFLSLKISSLPAQGKLTNNGVAVVAGASVSAADIAAGKLKFTPVINGFGATYASFTFQVRDNGGTANGGIDLDPLPKKMTIAVT